MENLTASPRFTASQLTPDVVVSAGYKRHGCLLVDCNRFVCFKVGEVKYNTLKEVKMAYGVRNLKELEFEVNRLEQGSVTAEFDDIEGGFFWGAYLWSGAFRVGTSADRLVLGA